MTSMPQCGKFISMYPPIYRNVQILLAVALFFLISSPHVFAQHSGTPSETKAFLGVGFESRGSSGRAAGLYTGFSTVNPYIQFRSSAAFDAFRMQQGKPYIADFRSIMIELGLGRAFAGPFSLLFRLHFERFNASKSSIFSALPRVAFDTRHFFITTGMNIRTFAMDNGNPLEPWYTRTERQFTFAIGTRMYFLKPLAITLAMNNFDDYATGNFASIGFSGEVSVPVNQFDLAATFGYRPAGNIALTSTPSNMVCRVFVRRIL